MRIPYPRYYNKPSAYRYRDQCLMCESFAVNNMKNKDAGGLTSVCQCSQR